MDTNVSYICWRVYYFDSLSEVVRQGMHWWWRFKTSILYEFISSISKDMDDVIHCMFPCDFVDGYL